ncbi:hypothetical protein FBF28_01670 [Candidatus Saccharibacteria bacterium oral taxon 488]|nr:hypothetical protein FBF28_01670 [Candidatus Saccharibacteria bacterium oral taxon 488]
MPISTVKSFSLVAVWILIGILIGAVGYHFLFNYKLMYIDTKVDLGSVIALLALAISVSVTPFIIDRKLNNQRSYEAMVCGEIEEIIRLLEAVDSLYLETYAKESISEENVKQLRRLIRKIQNRMDTILGESSPLLTDFKEKIGSPFDRSAYPALTDKFQKGAQLSESDYLNALNQIESTISALKTKRYRIYR